MSATTTTGPGRHHVPQPAAPGRRPRPVARVEGRGPRAARRAAVLVLGSVLVVPLVPVVIWAVAQRWRYPDVVPEAWGLDGWRGALEQGAAAAVVRSTVLGLVVSVVATPLGALAGRALAVLPVPAGRAVTLVLLLPVALPPFAVVMGLSTASLRAGLPGTLALVVVLVVAAIPYTTFVMRSAFGRYDTGYDEAGRTLGASGWTLARRVQLPLVAPALVVAAFLAFLVGWSDYVFTLVLAAGRFTTVQQLLGASASGSGNQSTTAVLAVLAAVPPLLLLAVVRAVTGGRTAS